MNWNGIPAGTYKGAIDRFWAALGERAPDVATHINGNPKYLEKLVADAVAPIPQTTVIALGTYENNYDIPMPDKLLKAFNLGRIGRAHEIPSEKDFPDIRTGRKIHAAYAVLFHQYIKHETVEEWCMTNRKTLAGLNDGMDIICAIPAPQSKDKKHPTPGGTSGLEKFMPLVMAGGRTRKDSGEGYQFFRCDFPCFWVHNGSMCPEDKGKVILSEYKNRVRQWNGFNNSENNVWFLVLEEIPVFRA